MKKTKSQRPNRNSGLPFPSGSYCWILWMNYLTNLTYTIIYPLPPGGNELPNYSNLHHRINSSCREFNAGNIGKKNNVFNNFSWNSTEVIININDVIPKYLLLSVDLEKSTLINLSSYQSQSSVWSAAIGCSINL